MEDKMPFTVKSKSFLSYVDSNSTDFLEMKRTQNYQNDQSIVDAYGELWVFAFADLASNQLSIRNGNEYMPLIGKWGVLIGDYSLVEWQVQKGEFSWEAVTSVKKELPEEFKGKVFLLPWHRKTPKSAEELFDIIGNCQDKICIEQQMKTSAIALKTKKFIDNNYTDDVLIKTVANELNLSWAVMSREFKKCYGISPVDYRHKLRIFKALKELSSGYDVTKSLSESGFTSSSQFFTQFKKHLGVSPGSYHYDNKKMHM